MRTLLLAAGVCLLAGCAGEILDEGDDTLVVEAQPVVGECSVWTGAYHAYLSYVAAASCTGTAADDCLEPTSYVATRSDGRRVNVSGVYRWRLAGDRWADPGSTVVKPRVLVHFMTEYLKKLRNAYEECPELYGKVYDQVDFIVSDGVRRNGALVWENAHGVAQAMEQGDMASLFAGLAGRHYDHGHVVEARGTLRYALEAARAFFLPVGVRSGGVRSVDETWCAAKTARLRPCFWFHSRGRGVHEFTGAATKQTILNQHLHGVRDTLNLSVSLRGAAAYFPTDVPLPPGHRAWSDWSDALEDRAIGGLYVLAFSNGHKAVAPNRPPNLAQLMKRRGSGSGYFTAAYGFNLDTGLAYDISRDMTCHYQSHSLSLLATLRQTSIGYLVAEQLTEQGWRIDEALNRLLESGTDFVGNPASTHALLQFYWSSFPGYFQTQWGCPADARLKRGACEILAADFGLDPATCGVLPQ